MEEILWIFHCNEQRVKLTRHYSKWNGKTSNVGHLRPSSRVFQKFCCCFSLFKFHLKLLFSIYAFSLSKEIVSLYSSLVLILPFRFVLIPWRTIKTLNCLQKKTGWRGVPWNESRKNNVDKEQKKMQIAFILWVCFIK